MRNLHEGNVRRPRERRIVDKDGTVYLLVPSKKDRTRRGKLKTSKSKKLSKTFIITGKNGAKWAVKRKIKSKRARTIARNKGRSTKDDLLILGLAVPVAVYDRGTFQWRKVMKDAPPFFRKEFRRQMVKQAKRLR